MHEQPPNCTDDVIYTKPLIASVPRGAYRLRVKTPADPPLGAEVQEFAAIGGKNFKLEPQRLLYPCNGSTMVRRPTFICSSCAICSSGSIALEPRCSAHSSAAIGSCAKGSAPPLRLDRAPIRAKKGSSFKPA
jgi:hypothetical protein